MDGRRNNAENWAMRHDESAAVAEANGSSPAVGQAVQTEKPAAKKRRQMVFGKTTLSHIVLLVIALTMLLPFLWMVLASFKSLDEVEQLNPFPTVWHPENYIKSLRANLLCQVLLQLNPGRRLGYFPLLSYIGDGGICLLSTQVEGPRHRIQALSCRNDDPRRGRDDS